ncbi:alpha-1,3-galactosidase-related protein [Aquimarina agarilytica]|uniref:alpha-1,3-galactosidase-related protein n=1 Tax=Aquimarina agarilytica TaxID=1087449 RepID=UPI000289DE6E|nr:hypothetical protein [Aquimarina agarilytica]
MRFLKMVFLVALIIACKQKTSKSLDNENNNISRNDNEILIKNNPNIKDYTPIITNILKQNPNKIELRFEKGTYHFYPEKAQSHYVKISNNDNGHRKIIFPAQNFEKFLLNGGNSDFVFHGSLIPFQFKNSTNISLKKINLFWDKPFTFEGEVIESNNTTKVFTIKVNENNDYEIENNELFFKGYDWKLPLGENIIYDKTKLRPYYNTSSFLQWNKLKAKEIEKGVIQFSGYQTTKDVPPVGSIFVDKGPHGQNRRYPAIHLTASSKINLNDINVYASGAMALIAERCDTLTLNSFNVLLSKRSKQMIGASADATHFVNCKGLVTLENCRFENMLDDATNIHGTYMVISEILGKNKFAVKPMHYQQEGFNIAEKGDELRFITRTDLHALFTGTVKTAKQINEKKYIIEMEEPLPLDITTEIAVENTTWMASVLMKNCSVKQNRARSILISTSKKVEILDNYFSSMMAGVRVCGDANYWFESGPVTDLTIRGNTFEDLGIGGAKPQAILQVDPIIGKKFRSGNYFHKNIVFDNNTINTFDPHIVYALSVDGLQITNNKIIQTNTYNSIFSDLSQFDIQNCKNVLISGNHYIGKKSAEISIIDSNIVKIKENKGFNTQTVINPNKYFFQN